MYINFSSLIIAPYLFTYYSSSIVLLGQVQALKTDNTITSLCGYLGQVTTINCFYLKTLILNTNLGPYIWRIIEAPKFNTCIKGFDFLKN